MQIPLSKIVPPTHNYARKARTELLDSIKEHGLRIPIAVVQAVDGRYLLVDGYQRYRCVKALGGESIAAKIIEKGDRMKSEMKQVYLERNWVKCELVSQKGLVITVKARGVELEVPYQWVRDLNPTCQECSKRLFGTSYQTHAGTSICERCYPTLDEKSILLNFGSHQWLSWDGQIAMSDMGDSHLINTIGLLNRNAHESAAIAGGSPSEYLSPAFKHLVNELRSRRPDDLGDIKMNSVFLYIWTVILVMLGARGK